MLKKIEVFYRNFKISPKIALKKVINSVMFKYIDSLNRKRDYEKSTFIDFPDLLKEINYSYYNLPLRKNLEIYKDTIISTANLTIEHKFNLLGSGWVKVFHGTETKGIEGLNYQANFRFTNWKEWLAERIPNQNLGESYRISQLISPDYTPIDWQLDFKSGFRWNETAWYKDIVYGDVPGADIKVPWELGRMQYLINLAYASILSKEEASEKKSDKYSYDFQNQILGFISSNPPRYGVQWMSSMDVGIRAVNWLVAYDLFRANGIYFDANFKRIFARSIYEHGLHIINNLEWSSGLRGNHYLSNVVSLLFISAFLPITEISSLWLAFSIQEIINELEHQFYEEGANFEDSTSYHLFASEMIFHAFALILALPQDKLSSIQNYKNSNWNYKKKLLPLKMQKYSIETNLSLNFDQSIWDKLKSIALFSYAISTSTGKYPQIGDNDSGRFLKLTPFKSLLKNELMTAENSSENTDFTDIYANMINNDDQRIPLSIYSAIVNCQMISKVDNAIAPYFPLIEYDIISNLLKNSSNHFCQLSDDEIQDFVSCDKLFVSEDDEESAVLSFVFPKFGLFISKGQYYHATVKCGIIGQFGKGGHTHNDQLSFTLTVADKEIIVDPGTYVYTSFPNHRNNFRSVFQHNTLTIDSQEQNLWTDFEKDDLFWLSKIRTKSKCFQFSDNIFIGEHYAYTKPHKRILSYYKNKIEGVDICELNEYKQIRFHLAPDLSVNIVDNNTIAIHYKTIIVNLVTKDSSYKIEDYDYSPAYGIIQKSKRIILTSKDSHIHWKIEIISI
jgi:hypothetical protein